MTSENIDRLREMQRSIEKAAASATTRAELVNLRALWGDLESVIKSEVDNGTDAP